MKQIKCEMCGSTDLIKQDGVFVCQSCGIKYSVEDAKKMMVEGVVEVAGTVQVDNSATLASLLKRTFLLLEDRNWNSANEYCEKVLDIAPECAEAYLGKLMVDLKITHREDLKKCDKPFDDNQNYKRAVRFADDCFKKELDDVLQQINEKVYEEAKSMLENGWLADAIRLLKSIENYKDAATLLEKAINESKSRCALACVKLSDKWGYIDETGAFVIKPQFSLGLSFGKNGLAGVKLKYKWGYINEIGEVVIKLQFDSARTFSNGFAQVKLNDKWGYINETGEFVTKPQFDESRPFKNGFAQVKLNDKWGYINETGAFVIKPQFDGALPFDKNGHANVRLNGKWKCIDETGKDVGVVQLGEGEADEFKKNGLARAESYGKWGFIDRSGEFVIKPRFDETEDFYIFSKKDIAERKKRCELIKKNVEAKRLAEIKAHNNRINAQIAELTKALATQKAIYAENSGKIFGSGAKLKKTAMAEIPRLEAEIANLKKHLK